MPLPGFEALCAVVVAAALFAMARRRPAAELLADYCALAVAGWIGEETCIAFYDFYRYAASWHARLADVPLAIPLIWPLVILSAREVAGALWPGAGRRARPWIVGAIVIFDASLVEVIAVRAGLWSWAEPGHLGVPIIGILGWGYFAVGAEAALALRGGRLITILIAPIAAHTAILISWWGLFRWTLRGDLGVASVIGVAILGGAAFLVALHTRRAGRTLAPSVALPRMIAAALFFAVLLRTAPRDVPLWIHVASVALPYFAVIRY